MQQNQSYWTGNLRSFLRCEAGAITLDFVIWVPVFCAILAFAADVSLTFYGYSRMWDVARDTGRRVATGQFDATEGQVYALQQLPLTSSFTVDIDDSSTDDIVVTISTQGMGLVFGNAFWGAMDVFSETSLSATYTMRKEGAGMGPLGPSS